MAQVLSIDRGDRLTLQVPISRTAGEAGPMQFAVAAGQWTAEDWVTVSPVSDQDLTAVYELLIAHGDTSDFTGAHPSGTVVITSPVTVWMRPPTGTTVDVELVAWITPT